MFKVNLPNIPDWESREPFDHLIIDDFLEPEVAEAVAAEFPAFGSDVWFKYENAIEVKKAHNNWNRFGPVTYKLFDYLNQDQFLAKLDFLPGCVLFPDYGLNGGGLHTHRSGGKLNVHLDYSIHPKLGLERRLNLIIYVTPDWQEEWGGHLGLYKDRKTLVKKVLPKFNRAVIFDTTQNSWHGLPEPIQSPLHITRNSLATYYLCKPREGADTRGRALFAPTAAQENDPKVLELIEKRSNVNTSSEVYRETPK